VRKPGYVFSIYHRGVPENPIKYVFLDTQVYLQASMNFSEADVSALASKGFGITPSIHDPRYYK